MAPWSSLTASCATIRAGRQTLHLDYEAYEEMAAKQMQQLADEARTRFAVRHVTMIHRLGRLEVGETSVLIVVASAHRAQAFEACRWLIDTLKKTVPIWKKETFVDGRYGRPASRFPQHLAVAPPEASHERVSSFKRLAHPSAWHSCMALLLLTSIALPHRKPRCRWT